MNGIFPDYIGQSVEARHGALFPDWIGTGEIEVIVEVPAGGGSKGKAGRDAYELRLIREDEEILALIMMAIRIMQ